ncbi:exo-alpha-sialidase [Streptomyces sp. NPDC127098]|uniref:exo-alpha-sialidase n=1 Tax=Streptomyces sp. NPDC127098 TaxID=3347137 RepID=UPI003647D369
MALTLRRAAVAAATLALTLPPLPSLAAAPSAEPGVAPSADPTAIEQQVIFRAAEDGGYACFRIPAIVRTNAGTLLAFAEGRTNDCTDGGDIDIVVKRSTDGGRTWSPYQVIDEGDGDTHGNPAPVVDTRTGRILLPSTRNPGVPGGGDCQAPCQRIPYLSYSDDDGLTWSEPRSLAEELRPDDWNSWYATGPVHGVQLTRGEHAGRLVFTVNAESYADGRITHGHAALAYSDDGGDSWTLGAVDSYPVAVDGTWRQRPSEATLAELPDGTLYINGREQGGTDLGHRTHAWSRDGGETLTAPYRAVPDLYAPQVQGSVLPFDDERLLLAVPSDPDRRRRMMVRSSWDGGRTWESVEQGALVTTDWSGYSDMVRIDGATVGLMYEAGPVDARDEIRFARFGADFLGPRDGAGPTTRDAARGAAPATVHGGAATTDGRFGAGVAFDGADDAVRPPYREELPLGDGDFTVSLWFRYEATSGQHPFLWMGGVGGNNPQVWIRAEPGSGRIRALLTARDGGSPPASASVDAPAAHNDGRWHHLAFTRSDGRLSLAVDGGEPVTAADVAGSVSRNSTFGVHLGQRPDRLQWMSGALDEVRVYDRALSAGELAWLRAFNVGPRDAVVSLPLDRVR